MVLFDSGAIAPAGTFSFFVNGASTYSAASLGDPFAAQVIMVPPVVHPTSGTTTTPFNVTWAGLPPPANLMFDVFVKEPGSSDYAQWQLGATTTGATFLPDAGPGTYTFYARIRNIADRTERDSPKVSISVS